MLIPDIKYISNHQIWVYMISLHAFTPMKYVVSMCTVEYITIQCIPSVKRFSGFVIYLRS